VQPEIIKLVCRIQADFAIMVKIMHGAKFRILPTFASHKIQLIAMILILDFVFQVME
jgi:hypothetical protein